MTEWCVFQTIAGTRLDHGGTSRSVPSLCDALADLGVSVQLVTGRPADSSVECNYPSTSVPVRLIQESKIHRHLGMTRRFRLALAHSLTQSEGTQRILHDHGLWLSTNRAAAGAARQWEITRVVSPRGMLTNWSLRNGRLKKKIAWRLFQHRDLQSADAFHATGDQEAEDLRALGFEQPIAVIPNGVALPNVMPERKRENDQKQVLFLSRIHPKKGLLNLIRAWAAVSPDASWSLVLAGPDENGHRREVESLARKLGVFHRLKFTGPVTDDEKWNLYRAADLFVLPSFSENFGMVIAEALAAGLPVITTRPTPWGSLHARNIGWWVEPTVEGINRALREALNQTDAERSETGRRAADWAQRQFAWPAIGRQMIEFYRWLLKLGDRPQFVI